MARPLDIVANCKRCNSMHVVKKAADSYIINSCFHCYTEFEIDIKNKILIKLRELVGKDLVSDILLTSEVLSIKITNFMWFPPTILKEFIQVEIGDIYNEKDIIAICFSFRDFKMIYIIEENNILYKRYRNNYYERLIRGESIIMSW